ncbi:MAG TPA: LuxR C-terminal-related transcriptional regulator [Actinomycetota bacterium]|nr:LuxR C-terminal-related transcriptional regulator [Actinomycetota bacterium]
MSGLDPIHRLCDGGLGERELRAAVLAALRDLMPFEHYAWLLTDPQSWVGTAPLADVPLLADLPELVRLKYLTATNRWTGVAADGVSTLQAATVGHPSRSRLWRELLAGYGVGDVASLVFRDRYGCWAFLDLWRMGGAFNDAECAQLTDVVRIVTPALRHSLGRLFQQEPSGPHGTSEPVVLLLSEDLRPLGQTPSVDARLRELLPTPAHAPPVPAAAFNVAAQLLAREQGIDAHPPTARAYAGRGRWTTVSAARFTGVAPAIAIDFEPTSPADRSELFARVVGFSERERELLAHLVAGRDTREIAQQMFVSEHTVQDHLKAMFAKAAVHGRRLLVARATGMR